MQERSISRLRDGSSLRVTVPSDSRHPPPPPDNDVDEEQLRTLWCGGVNEQCDEEILFELFQNAGPLQKVTIPKDRETKRQKNYAFIVYQHEESVKFAYDLLNGTEIFKQRIRLQNKTTGLGMDQGRHQRSFSASAPSTPNQNMMGGARRGPMTPPAQGFGWSNQQGQVPYGYGGNMGGGGGQYSNGRDWEQRDQGRSRDGYRDRNNERRRDDSRDYRDRSYDKGEQRQHRRY